MPMRSSALSSRLLEVRRVYAPAVQSVLRQALERWLPSPGQGTKIAAGILRTRLSLFCVVRGTYNTSARGGLGSWRDTITTGRVFAASPRSANQTSPGCGLIEQVENLLFRRARAHQIENVLVGQVNDLCYALSYVSRRFRLPLAQPGVQPFHQYIHGGILPQIQFSSAGPPSAEPPDASGKAAPRPPALPETSQKRDMATRPCGIVNTKRRFRRVITLCFPDEGLQARVVRRT